MCGYGFHASNISNMRIELEIRCNWNGFQLDMLGIEYKDTVDVIGCELARQRQPSILAFPSTVVELPLLNSL